MNSLIQTPSGNLKESLNFYQKLNFKKVEDKDRTLVTDGKALIEINPHKFARAGFKFYKESWKEEVALLESMTKVQKTDEAYLLSDPSNCWIYLIEGNNKTTFAQAENISSLGISSGISLETLDIERSIALWSILGFKKSMGDIEQGWVVYTNDDQFSVSFMRANSCPHLFFNPSLTYFNGGKNLPVIQKIRDAGVPFTQEITHFNTEGIVDNVIIRDPGGLGFFIFND